MSQPTFHATTVLAVRRDGRVVMAADGQVTLGDTVVKHGARKIRRLHDDRVIAGFAGATADAFALFERFEAKLKDYSGNITVVIRDDCHVTLINSYGVTSSGHFTMRSGDTYSGEIDSLICGEGTLTCLIYNDDDDLRCDYSYDDGGVGEIY